jgi:hypothetical protein
VDEAYTRPRGSVDIRASYLEYIARLNGVGIKLSPGQKTWCVKKGRTAAG